MKKNDSKSWNKVINFADCIIGDECHQLKSTQVAGVMDGFVNSEYRVGTTGTLDGIQINTLTLTGIFGTPLRVISARELIDAGQATDVEIRIMVLKHPEHIRKALKNMKYDEEVNHIMANTARNDFICNLANACNGNTLVLYNQVKKHGDLLHKRLQEITKKKVYYVHGKVDADEREEIRKIVETEENSIILATSSLMATGTNIPSIANLIMTMPGRSNIRIRQSIGRGLRLKDGKFLTRVFDIADDYSYKAYKNSAIKQLDERVSVYSKEEFIMKVTDVDLKY
jgi:superfamily II DNA or RNA helicase